jgi:FkbM family methyltransferase
MLHGLRMMRTNRTTETLSVRRSLGMFRTRLIYDYKPFNRKRMVRFYSLFIMNGDLCFDIGAHTGNRTGTWLSMGAKVVAAEPQPAFIRFLKKKFGTNPWFNLESTAIGNMQGRARLHISRMNPAISTLSEQWKNILTDFQPALAWEDAADVEVQTLDNLLAKYGIPVFCKIDVEGFELEVLSGLSVPLPALSFELFPTTPGRTIECITKIENLGSYEYNWSLTESFRMKSPFWLNASDMIHIIMNYSGRKSGDIYARLRNR